MWSKETFIPELRKFDPLLRLRRSWDGSKWMIERKCRRESKCIMTPSNKADIDVINRKRDGYVYVMSFPYNMLGGWVIRELRERDSWQFKDANKHADAIEAQEALEEKQKDRQMDNLLEDASDDAYDFLHWRQGERVAIQVEVPK